MEGTGKQEVVMVMLEGDRREYSVTEGDVSLGMDQSTQPSEATLFSSSSNTGCSLQEAERQ